MSIDRVKGTFSSNLVVFVFIFFPFSFVFFSLVITTFLFIILRIPSYIDSFYYFISFYTPFRLFLFSLYCFLFSLIFFSRVIQRAYKNLHGSAGWGTLNDLKANGFTDNNGVVLGVKQGKVISHITDAHTLFVAATRMGKTVSMVITTLLRLADNIFVLDIKGELYEKTKIFRQYFFGHKIIYLNPSDPNTDKFNPLSLVDLHDDPLAMIERIATILYPYRGGDDTFWQDSAKNLFKYSAYYVLLKAKYNEKEDEDNIVPSLADVHNLWAGTPEEVMEKINNDIEENIAFLTDNFDVQQIRIELEAFVRRPEKERGSVFSSFTIPLKTFLSSRIRSFTSETSFSLHDLMYGKMTIYFCIATNDIKRLANFVSIFMEIVLTVLAIKQDENRRMIHFLLDEFTSIGKVNNLTYTLAFLASYKVRFIFIIQSLSQLEHVYGKETGIITGNCAIQLFSATNDNRTRTHISDSLGDRTVIIEKGKGKGREKREVKRPLLTPAEVGLLKGMKGKWGIIQAGEFVLIIANLPPFIVGRLVYFKNSFYTDKIF